MRTFSTHEVGLLVATLTATSGMAQVPTTYGVAAPVLGYVFDAGKSGVRPLMGIPTAAVAEEAIRSAHELSSALLAPGEGHGVGLTTDGSHNR